MAQFGIVAGIHGNGEALQAVLAALDRRGVHRLLCAGDIVGYNADPDECAAMVRSRAAGAVAGRHDLIVTGRLGFQRCSNHALHSLRRTRRAIASESAQWLRSLPERCAVGDEILVVHGGLRSPEVFMTNARELRQNAAWLRADFPGVRVCFFGRSHAQRAIRVDGDDVLEMGGGGRLQLERGALYFVNPGAVDAQRRREHRLAECAIFDTAEWTVEFLRVPYDAASAEAKAAVFGYRVTPLGERLIGLRRRILMSHDRRPKAERLSD